MNPENFASLISIVNSSTFSKVNPTYAKSDKMPILEAIYSPKFKKAALLSLLEMPIQNEAEKMQILNAVMDLFNK